jgi:hypothetical protein
MLFFIYFFIYFLFLKSVTLFFYFINEEVNYGFINEIYFIQFMCVFYISMVFLFNFPYKIYVCGLFLSLHFTWF